MITPPILRISSEENEQIASSEERTLATNRLPRILLICYSYPPVLGGSEVEAQRVASGLIKRGYQVEVLTGAEPPMPTQSRWIDPRGVPVRIIGIRWARRWQPRIFALGVAWLLWRERRRYQLVYFLMQ